MAGGSRVGEVWLDNPLQPRRRGEGGGVVGGGERGEGEGKGDGERTEEWEGIEMQVVEAEGGGSGEEMESEEEDVLGGVTTGPQMVIGADSRSVFIKPERSNGKGLRVNTGEGMGEGGEEGKFYEPPPAPPPRPLRTLRGAPPPPPRSTTASVLVKGGAKRGRRKGSSVTFAGVGKRREPARTGDGSVKGGVVGGTPMQPGQALLRLRDERPASLVRKRYKRRLYFLVSQGKAFTTGFRRLRFVLVGALIMSILAILLETYESGATRAAIIVGCAIIEVLQGLVFTFDLGAQLYTCTVDTRLQAVWVPAVVEQLDAAWPCCRVRPRVAYVTRLPVLTDIVTLVPTYMWVLSGGTFDIFGRSVLASWVRLIRLGRVSKSLRYIPGLRMLMQVLDARRADLLTGLTMGLVSIVVLGLIVFTVEHAANPDDFPNLWVAWYFGAITLSTVGYGDIAPVTSLGRIVTVAMAVSLIGIFTLPAGIIASGFTDLSQKGHRNLAEGLLRLDRVESRFRLRTAVSQWREWAEEKVGSDFRDIEAAASSPALTPATAPPSPHLSSSPSPPSSPSSSPLGIRGRTKSVPTGLRSTEASAQARSLLRAAAEFAGLSKTSVSTSSPALSKTHFSAASVLRRKSDTPETPLRRPSTSSSFAAPTPTPAHPPLSADEAREVVRANRRLALAADLYVACAGNDAAVMLELARVLGRQSS